MNTKARIRVAALMAAALALTSANSRPAIGGHALLAVKPDIEVIIGNILGAWNRSDAHAIATQYEPDGDFVSPNGAHVVGHAAIEAFYRAAFDGGYVGSLASATVLHVRRPTAAFALVDGSWTIDPTPKSKITSSEAGLFVALLHYDADHWRIVALREQTSAQTLQELASGRP